MALELKGVPTFRKRAAAGHSEVVQRRQIEPAAARERRCHAVRHTRVRGILNDERASWHRATGSVWVRLVLATTVEDAAHRALVAA